MTAYGEIVQEARADERELVRVERREDRAVVRLADPGKLNVLSAALTGPAAGVGLAFALLRMEEFAEPNCFTTAAFARSVESMLARG